MTRTAYGTDEICACMAWESLPDWQQLSVDAGLPIFRIGVLFFFPGRDPYAEQSLVVHRRLGLPTEVLDKIALRKRRPQIDWMGVEFGLYEPQLGPLMARRAVQTLVERFVRAGGEYVQAAIMPPGEGARLDAIRTADGAKIDAERFAFACGPWLPRLFP